jgi:hypothetical protein
MLVEVVDVPFGGGSVLPGESIVPATTETASATIRMAAAHVWRNLVTFLYLQKIQKFLYEARRRQVFLQGFERLR